MGNKQSKPDWNNDEKHQSVSAGNALESRSEADSHFEEPNPLPQALDPRQVQSAALARQPLIQRDPRNIDDPQRNIQLSQKIASVSHLLRDMYSLDLKIFGTESGRPEDDGERNTMIDQANMLFETVWGTLTEWEAEPRWWTDDELKIIKTIRVAACCHDPRKHRKRRGNTT